MTSQQDLVFLCQEAGATSFLRSVLLHLSPSSLRTVMTVSKAWRQAVRQEVLLLLNLSFLILLLLNLSMLLPLLLNLLLPLLLLLQFLLWALELVVVTALVIVVVVSGLYVGTTVMVDIARC